MSEQETVRVLIVDDSATARAALREAFAGEPGIQVVGEAADAPSALAKVQRLKPDLVTMDVYMKGCSGLEISAEIMHAHPTPILMVTGVDPKDPSLVYEALRVGVLEVCGKLPAPASVTYVQRRAELGRLVRCLAKVPVVRRRRPAPREAPSPEARVLKTPSLIPPQIVVIGASTGGPPIVCELLKQLPTSFQIPVALVQHMADGFTSGFARWLEGQTGRRVTIVTERTALEPGVVYIGTEGRHFEVVGPSHVATFEGPEHNYHRPSADILFRSAAIHFGSAVIGVILTGMGSDGADGMRALFNAGAWTFAQHPSTCAADGMPRTAIANGSARLVLMPEELAGAMVRAGTRGSGA
ncbi:MAG: chemotaxis protein CheB [Polyangiaceae bacterium]|nr:chemotaxis protein CheB [Polyangiaceae bacterium]